MSVIERSAKRHCGLYHNFDGPCSTIVCRRTMREKRRVQLLRGLRSTGNRQPALATDTRQNLSVGGFDGNGFCSGIGILTIAASECRIFPGASSRTCVG